MPLLTAVLLLFWAGALPSDALLQPPLVRVSMNDAKAHILTKVDPIVPPEATQARVGGIVSAEVVIRADGSVEAVTILAGPDMLHRSAIEAVTRWTFKPFVDRGRAARVVTIVDVPFPDPIRDEEKRRADAYWTRDPQCRRLLESGSPSEAERVCRELAEASEQLPADRVLERSHAWFVLGTATLRAGRPREALALFERSLAIRRKAVPYSDADNASTVAQIATVQASLGEIAKAEASFAASVQEFEAAMKALPDMQELYAPQLAQILRASAGFERSVADTKAAAALETKAAALDAPVPAVASLQAKVIRSVTCLGPAAGNLTDADVKQIQDLFRAGSEQAWLVVARLPERGRGAVSWSVEVYMNPRPAKGAVHHGQVRFVSAALPDPAAFAEPRTWRVDRLSFPYAQAPEAGRNPRDVVSAVDHNRPFKTPPTSHGDLTDAEVASLASFVRAKAVKASGPRESPRLSTDVQPWPIDDMVRWDQAEVHVTLVDPWRVPSRPQRIVLRREGDGWAIVSLR
jgi:TonB family protein